MSDGIKYPWQQPVLDAFLAPSNSLPLKISIAEGAIAARLTDPQQTDLTERIALNDALRALRVLLEETKRRPEQPEDRKREDIA
ncbi:MAG: hypothetical protein DMG30_10665 [Acidobacteria bacterium]|nr:MAG: hypothetical protein DMG30_10665 [Acidobacteriota bacterium]